MASVYHDVRRRGGIARTYELLADGHTSHRLTTAVRRGEVIRVRQGHYACPELPEAQQCAVRVGGRLTGLSGARALGIWAARASGGLEVSVPGDARALRTPTNPRMRLSEHPKATLQVRWTDRGASGTRSILNTLDCLREIVRAQPEIVGFTAAESAMHLGLISRSAIRSLGLRRHTAALSSLSESGGESMLKFHLLSGRIVFHQQVRIAGVGRVDFVVGDRLVIEVDGAAFHTSSHAFEEDRRRDAALAARGYLVLRFSYRQVERRWPEVSAALAIVMARCEHL